MKKMGFYIAMCVILFTVACNNSTKSHQNEINTNSIQSIKDSSKTIVFFGNSLTAGYGLDHEQAFPAIIQQKIDSLHLNWQIVNAGVSGETTTAGLARIDWILQKPLNIFVLELGGNDGLRGIPLDVTEQNLQAIIDKVKAKYPSANIVLAGMQLPPNLSIKYTKGFATIYPKLAQKNNIMLLPFLLEGVGGNPNFNQPDGIHPNAAGAKTVADNVWKIIHP
jgi:acyl-CoA thioesterase-1